jgi:hypothetical protein
MKESSIKSLIPNWLDNPRLSHVQACWMRLASGESHIQVAGTDSANEPIEQAMQSIAAIVPLLTSQHLAPGWIIWNFVSGRLYYVVRADGATLALYCKIGTDPESAAVGELLTEFVQRM